MTGPDTRPPIPLLPGGVGVAGWGRVTTHPAGGRRNLWPLVVKHGWHLRRPLAQARLAPESAG